MISTIKIACVLSTILALTSSSCSAFVTSSSMVLGTSSTSLGGAAALVDYSSQAASLFNNMKTPASILGGAIVGLGFGSPLPAPTGEETKLEQTIRKSYLVVAAISLLSQLISIMWATVAVNKLTECANIGPAESVWHLIQSDFDMSWAGTNAHFVLGMLSFSYIIGVRSYFLAGRGTLGQCVATMSGSALMFMMGIVNRGVAAGSGDGQGYGLNVMSLFKHYLVLLIQKNTHWKTLRPLEIGSVALASIALFRAMKLLIQSLLEARKGKDSLPSP